MQLAQVQLIPHVTRFMIEMHFTYSFRFVAISIRARANESRWTYLIVPIYNSFKYFTPDTDLYAGLEDFYYLFYSQKIWVFRCFLLESPRVASSKVVSHIPILISMQSWPLYAAELICVYALVLWLYENRKRFFDGVLKYKPSWF